MDSDVVDLLSPQIQADPFPTYARLIRDAPVACCEPGGIWTIARYEDVKFALRNPQIFSSAGFNDMYRPSWLSSDCLRDPFILGQDPPLHGDYRSLVNRAFLPRIVDGLEPLMEAIAERQLMALKAKGVGEFIADFSYPYTGQLIGQLTGTAETQDIAELREWLELLEAMTPVDPGPCIKARTEFAIRRQNAYFDEIIDARRHEPREDIVTRIVRSELEGEPLDNAILRSCLDLLITAGLGTTNYTLCNSMILLSRRPRLLAELKVNADRIPKFVEEILRFDPSTHCLLRKTTAEVLVGNSLIPQQALVAVLVGAANRDPAKFEVPNDFILGRKNAREHLAFGYGAHACIGAALARLELKVALTTIVRNVNQIVVPDHDDLRWITSLTTHGLAELPITLR